MTIERKERSNDLDHLIASFQVSAGSPHAQALYERAYALANGILIYKVSSKFKIIADDLNLDENMPFKRAMGHAHKDNRRGQQTVKMGKQRTGNLATVVQNELPHGGIFGSNTMDLLEEQLEGVGLARVDDALKRAWIDGDIPKTTENIRCLAAATGLYDYAKVGWWEQFPREQKAAMINVGNKLLKDE